MIINYYVGNTDWASASAQHNWYVNYNKTSGTGKWRLRQLGCGARAGERER